MTFSVSIWGEGREKVSVLAVRRGEWKVTRTSSSSGGASEGSAGVSLAAGGGAGMGAAGVRSRVGVARDSGCGERRRAAVGFGDDGARDAARVSVAGGDGERTLGGRSRSGERRCSTAVFV